MLGKKILHEYSCIFEFIKKDIFAEQGTYKQHNNFDFEKRGNSYDGITNTREDDHNI